MKIEQNIYIYTEIKKGMYGLPQRWILQRAYNHMYTINEDTRPEFWNHKWRLVTFSLVVDDLE